MALKNVKSRRLIGLGHLEYAEMLRLKKEQAEYQAENENTSTIKVMTVDISQSPIMLDDVQYESEEEEEGDAEKMRGYSDNSR